MTVKLYVKFYVHRFITVFIVVAAAYKIKEKKTIFFISKYLLMTHIQFPQIFYHADVQKLYNSI